jgi:hypothetical protein
MIKAGPPGDEAPRKADDMNPPRFSWLLFSTLLLASTACHNYVIGGGTGGGNSCGGVCNGMIQSSAPVSTVGTLAGTWELCGGQLYLKSADTNGFPPDTMGFEILADGTTYVHVDGDAGSFPRGVGPEYVWQAALNTPIGSSDSSITILNLTSSYLIALLGYDVTFMPAADGCGAALHLQGVLPGWPESADLIAR